MNKLRLIFCSILCLWALSAVCADEVETEKFITVNVHLMGGASYATNNYRGCFPEITDINSSMGPLFGAGVEGVFRLGSHAGLGTGLNLTRNQRRMDIAVTGAGKPSVSNVFQRNIYWELDFPVYFRWDTRLAEGVDWNVDGGLYYAYGISGNQKNVIYDAKTNDLGQLITSRTELKTGYYSNEQAFINSYTRADIGLHIATGLTFKQKFTVGVRSHIGLKNVAKTNGLVKPSSHNISLQAMIGWNF